MSYSLSLRPSALAEIEAARDGYAPIEHADSFVDAVEVVLDAIRSEPLRFPVLYRNVHRALLRRYPFAVFFCVRPATEHVVGLAVLAQRADPAKWPSRRP